MAWGLCVGVVLGPDHRIVISPALQVGAHLPPCSGMASARVSRRASAVSRHSTVVTTPLPALNRFDILLTEQVKVRVLFATCM